MILLCDFFCDFKEGVRKKICDLPLVLTDHLSFQHNRALFIFYDVLIVKKRICSSVGDHIGNSAIKNKKQSRNP